MGRRKEEEGERGERRVTFRTRHINTILGFWQIKQKKGDVEVLMTLIGRLGDQWLALDQKKKMEISSHQPIIIDLYAVLGQ